MASQARAAMTIESASSNKQKLIWSVHGCQGKDLVRYLASQGYRICERTLYNYGHSRRKKYTPTDLIRWKDKVQQIKYA
jgi:hypothetical protein